MNNHFRARSKHQIGRRHNHEIDIKIKIQGICKENGKGKRGHMSRGGVLEKCPKYVKKLNSLSKLFI